MSISSVRAWSSRTIHHLDVPANRIRSGNRRILRSQQAWHTRPSDIAITGVAHVPKRWRSDTAIPYTPSSSSVSSDEVSHFTRLASSWWDPYGPSRLLHLMNPLRHDFLQACLKSTQAATRTNPDEKYTYLDVGCGGGIFASSAARHPSTQSVTAIDPTPSVIQVARSHQRSDPALSEPKLRYINCAIEDLASCLSPSTSSESTFDIITLFEVIEHISSPSAFLHTALQHLKPGGWLVGSTIARHPISWLTTKLIAEAPLFGIVPRGTHNWEQYINPDELIGWFEGENRKAQRNTGVDDTGSSPSTVTATATATATADEQAPASDIWGKVRVDGVVYVPTLGWRWVAGSEKVGNYFFAVQKLRGEGGSRIRT